jgi:hypothetical protein
MKDQIVFKFPDKSFYYEEDFCVGEIIMKLTN